MSNIQENTHFLVQNFVQLHNNGFQMPPGGATGKVRKKDNTTSRDEPVTTARINTSEKEPIKPLEISITTSMSFYRSITSV